MKLNTCFGIAGLFLVGFAGCGGGSDAAAACNPTGTWTITVAPAAGDTCGDTSMTGTEIVSVSNGTATLVDPDGTTHQGPLDGSCHVAYTSQGTTPALSTSDSTEWTFTGASLYGSSNGTVTFTDPGTADCTVRLATFGGRQ